MGWAAFVGGDLFDDAYRDCPAATRLRDGQIADLTVTRDADDEDTVNVAWATTDPATWGLGGNALRTSLVLLLDGGGEDLHMQSLALGKRTAVFEDVKTGTEATLQMALVMRTPDGDYLISDILEANFHQSLSPPVFSGPVRRGLAQGCTLDPTEPAYEPRVPIHQCTFEATRGMVYFIGYGEASFNYKPAPGHPFNTHPATPRLRIGLEHGGEDNQAREDVDFEAYRIRIVDGNVIPEADDVATLSSADRGSPTVMISASNAHYDETVLLLGSSRAGRGEHGTLLQRPRQRGRRHPRIHLQHLPAPARPVGLHRAPGFARRPGLSLRPQPVRALFRPAGGRQRPPRRLPGRVPGLPH